MTITVATLAYNQDRISADQIAYAGPANTLSIVDILALSRVYPKPVKGFAGVAKPAAKFTHTVTLADETKADIIFTVHASIPVGSADADIDAAITKAKAFLDLELVGTTSLFKKLDITY